jgi:hypothetical protein
MKSKFIHLAAICLIAVLSLTLLFQSPASAFEGDEGSLGLSRGLTSGKAKPSLIPSDGFKVPDLVPDFRGKPSLIDSEGFKIPDPLPPDFRDKKPCICDGTPEVCDKICGGKVKEFI